MSLTITKTLLVLLTKLLLTKISLGIIGGKPSSNVAFPSVCLVKYHSNQYCGATLILPNWVMTAAHCIDPRIAKDAIQGVGLGFYNLGDFEGKIAATIEETINPKYKSSGTATIHDLGLMKLYDNVIQSKRIHPLPIATEKEYGLDSVCKTAGWGMADIRIHLMNLTEGAEVFHKENVLYEIDQIIVDIKNCNRRLGKTKTKLTLSIDTHICTRSSSNGSGPSFGDFGGPLICSGKQAGISSFVLYDPAIDKFLYAVYTPIIKHKEWIEQVLQLQNELPSNTNYVEEQKWGSQSSNEEDMVKIHPDAMKSKVLDIRCSIILLPIIGVVLLYTILT